MIFITGLLNFFEIVIARRNLSLLGKWWDGSVMENFVIENIPDRPDKFLDRLCISMRTALTGRTASKFPL